MHNDPVGHVDLWGLTASDSDNLYNTRPEIPYNQGSPELAGIEGLAESGCYFMACLFIAQDNTGINLTVNEIEQIVKDCQSTPKKTGSSEKKVECDFTVRDPDYVINKTFEVLDADKTATVGWGADNSDGQEQQPDYVIQKGKTKNGNYHYKVEGKYDPYQTGNGVTSPVDGCVYDSAYDIELIPVYIH